MCMHVCAQSCLSINDPMDASPPGPSVHWIVQARILEWVALASSKFQVIYTFQLSNLPLIYFTGFASTKSLSWVIILWRTFDFSKSVLKLTIPRAPEKIAYLMKKNFHFYAPITQNWPQWIFIKHFKRGEKISSGLKVRIRNSEPVGDKKFRMKVLSQPEHSCWDMIIKCSQ